MFSNTQCKNITTRYNDFNNIFNNKMDEVTCLFKKLAIDTKATIIIPSGTQLCPERRYPLLAKLEEAKMEDIYYITLNQSVEIKLDSEMKIKINNNEFVVVDQNISWSENNTYQNSPNKNEHTINTFTIPKQTPYCVPDLARDAIGTSHLLQADEKFKIRPGSTIYLPAGTEVVMLEENKNNIHMILRNITKCNI